MGRISKATAEDIELRLSTIESLLDEVQAIVPTIARLGELLPNLDRLGPRLDLIDEFGPQMQLIDQFGARMQLIDELGTLVGPLKRLCAQASILDSVGEVMNRFLTENHSVSESVRVDVETISALAAQVELFNRQILEQLQAALNR